MPYGTMINVTDTLYALRGNQTILSFKDIPANSFHLKTHCENEQEFFCVYLLMNADWSASWRNSWVNLVDCMSLWFEYRITCCHQTWYLGHRLIKVLVWPNRSSWKRCNVPNFEKFSGHPFFHSKRRHSGSSFILKHDGDAMVVNGGTRGHCRHPNTTPTSWRSSGQFLKQLRCTGLSSMSHWPPAMLITCFESLLFS